MSSDEEDTSLSDMAREFGFKIPTAASRSTVSTSGEFLGSGGVLMFRRLFVVETCL
jgi:hypothetical protein